MRRMLPKIAAAKRILLSCDVPVRFERRRSRCIRRRADGGIFEFGPLDTKRADSGDKGRGTRLIVGKLVKHMREHRLQLVPGGTWKILLVPSRSS